MITQKELTVDACVRYLINNISKVSKEHLFDIKCAHSNKTKLKSGKTLDVTQEELKCRLNYNQGSGKFFWLVDDSIAGYVCGTGYVSITLNGRSYRADRLAWLYVHGHMPKNQIDHINGIRSDNRIINLRDVTGAENCKNSKIASNNTSGFKGVEWIPSRNKWRALITSKGKKINVGSHSCKIDAVAAVMKARREYGFHKNHGRA